MVPESVCVPLPVFTNATVPEPFEITPLKLVEVLAPPVVNVAVVAVEPFVIVPLPAREPNDGE